MSTITQRIQLVIDSDTRGTAGIDETNRKLGGDASTGTGVGMAAMAGKARLAMLGVGAAAAAFGLGALNMARDISQGADEILKMSIRLGTTTEALSELQFVSERSGLEFNTMTMGLQRMTRRISEAAVGMGEAQGALKELNLDADVLNKMPLDEKFREIAGAISQVEGDADRVRLAMKLFDSEGVALIQTMTDGAEGIDALREKARQLGLSLSEKDAVAAAEFNDAVTDLSSSWDAFARDATLTFAPALTTITDGLTSGMQVLRSMAEPIDGTSTRVEELQRRIEGINRAIAIEEGGVFSPNEAAKKRIIAMREEIENLRDEIGQELRPQIRLQAREMGPAIEAMEHFDDAVQDVTLDFGRLEPPMITARARVRSLDQAAKSANLALPVQTLNDELAESPALFDTFGERFENSFNLVGARIRDTFPTHLQNILNGQGVGQTLEAVGGQMGQALGTAIAGPIGGIIGQHLGQEIAPIAAGFINNITGALGGMFGGGNEPDERMRAVEAARTVLEEEGVGHGRTSRLEREAQAARAMEISDTTSAAGRIQAALNSGKIDVNSLDITPPLVRDALFELGLEGSATGNNLASLLISRSSAAAEWLRSQGIEVIGAAKGFQGTIRRPTLMALGEGGSPEDVSVTPRGALPTGGGGPTIIINAVDVTSMDRYVRQKLVPMISRAQVRNSERGAAVSYDSGIVKPPRV